MANGESAESRAADGSSIFISYARAVEPDSSIAAFLHERLASEGHSVFMDIETLPGLAWSDLISSKITHSDFFVVLLSLTSVVHDYVVAETVMAKKREAVTGHPKIVPVRLAYTGELPLILSGAIGHLQHFEWRDPADDDLLLATILQAIGKPGGSAARPSALLRGDHFIITGSLWQSAGPRESLAGTTIVPVRAGQETRLAVTRATGPGFFEARVLDSGALEVAIWQGSNYRSVQSQPGQFIRMLEGDSHTWCFTKYLPDEAVLLKRPNGRKDPVVVTFDQDLVRAAWMITHQRGTAHESYLIVMKDSSAR